MHKFASGRFFKISAVEIVFLSIFAVASNKKYKNIAIYEEFIINEIDRFIAFRDVRDGTEKQ
jgi:hypothetical protein